ncbi:hypothetical protein VTK73DRAFT_8903 [Phialemonium thermophilum]|uniref:Uncharacterized protein n=1 Tax=Phialemonium thermophilum TaxID=223376 RepID=A0ABR3XMZ0_9PEZI
MAAYASRKAKNYIQIRTPGYIVVHGCPSRYCTRIFLLYTYPNCTASKMGSEKNGESVSGSCKTLKLLNEHGLHFSVKYGVRSLRFWDIKETRRVSEAWYSKSNFTQGLA